MLLPSAHEGSRDLGMYGVYFDESRTHADAPYICVAGCLASVDRWERFNVEWAGMLAKHGLTHYHAASCEHQRDEFKGWKKEDCNALHKANVEIIARHVQHIVCSAVVRQAYDGLPRFLNDAWAPYPFCAHNALGMLAAHMKRKRKGDLAAAVFEDGARGKGIVLSTYDFQKKYSIPGLGMIASIAFGDKKLVLPLQAADVVAYESAKEAKNASPEVGRQMRKSLETLLLAVRHNSMLFDSARFSRAMQLASDPPSSARDGSLVQMLKARGTPWNADSRLDRQ